MKKHNMNKYYKLAERVLKTLKKDKRVLIYTCNYKGFTLELDIHGNIYKDGDIIGKLNVDSTKEQATEILNSFNELNVEKYNTTYRVINHVSYLGGFGNYNLCVHIKQQFILAEIGNKGMILSCESHINYFKQLIVSSYRISNVQYYIDLEKDNLSSLDFDDYTFY